MAKPFDVTFKHMLEDYPGDCARLVGVESFSRIDVIDADLSTVTAMADKVLRLDDKPAWLMHFEFQASYEADLPQRMLQYNVLLTGRHKLPVRSVVLLLRREADGPEMSGVVRRAMPDGRRYLEFQYEVIRIWKMPVEEILRGGIGTLPLAPIAAASETEARSAVGRMKERLRKEASPSESGLIWTQTDILLGLRYSRAFAEQLLRGVQNMKESVTYQAIVEEGEVQGAQKILLRMGAKRFGPPDSESKAVLDGITDLERLGSLAERVSEVASWQELLAEPRPKRRDGRKRKS